MKLGALFGVCAALLLQPQQAAETGPFVRETLADQEIGGKTDNLDITFHNAQGNFHEYVGGPDRIRVSEVDFYNPGTKDEPIAMSIDRQVPVTIELKGERDNLCKKLMGDRFAYFSLNKGKCKLPNSAAHWMMSMKERMRMTSLTQEDEQRYNMPDGPPLTNDIPMGGLDYMCQKLRGRTAYYDPIMRFCRFPDETTDVYLVTAPMQAFLQRKISELEAQILRDKEEKGTKNIKNELIWEGLKLLQKRIQKKAQAFAKRRARKTSAQKAKAVAK
eukprot:GDKI01033043.1.p1 GENE.GDKI01033043.1~~GDKI01033043.1.p1  ORF type:complete len:274 (-),score=46.23 GDKI01033043.1:220-1041(-)